MAGVKRTKKAATKDESVAPALPANPTAPDAEVFRAGNGDVYHSYRELADALDTMTPAVWQHHVGEGRHDFAAWIQGVFHDQELADRIRAATSQRHAQVIIYRTMLERMTRS